MKRGELASPEIRANITAGLIKRHRRAREARLEEPTHKPCAKCGKVKPVAAFSPQRQKLKTGEISVRPKSRCKDCCNEDRRDERKRRRGEGVDLAARQRIYEARRDRKKLRAYQREWAAAKRREEGVPERGPSLKYRRRPKDNGRAGLLETEPLARFLEPLLKDQGPARIAEQTGIAERRLFAISNRETKSVTLETADRVLVGLGCPEQLPILYPDTSLGYHVLPPDKEIKR